jgi:hypothetical protein
VQDSDFASDPTRVSLRSGLSLGPDAIEHDAHLILKAFPLLSNLGPDAENFLNLDRLPRWEPSTEWRSANPGGKGIDYAHLSIAPG